MIKNEVILSAIYMIQDYSKGSHFLEETVNRVLTELKLLDKELEALQQPKSCEWEQCDTVFDTSWEGTCGAKWTIEHGTPKENHMNFCPQCGGKLIQIEAKDKQ